MKLDNMNGMLALDNMTAEAMRNLAPHKSTFDLNAPRAVSRNLSMPKPVVSTIANFIHSPEEPPDAEKIRRMSEIPCA